MKKSIEVTPNIETLFGTRDENLHLLEDGLNVTIDLRSNRIELEGAAARRGPRRAGFCRLSSICSAPATRFNNGDLNSMLRVLTTDPKATLRGLAEAGKQRSFGRRTVQPKSIEPAPLSRSHREARHGVRSRAGGNRQDVSRGGDGDLGADCKRVNRIILARPAVEAGERLGFLPGTLQEKIDPYLRPLYDALYDMLDPEKVDRYLEKNVIEIAPIAFMRGRTLNDSFVILDEAQNTTSEQMKMFVTRLGFNSKAVITGDITQIDLPNARRSGLLEAIDILKDVEGSPSCTSTKATWCGITWCSASSAPTTSTRDAAGGTADAAASREQGGDGSQADAPASCARGEDGSIRRSRTGAEPNGDREWVSLAGGRRVPSCLL